MLQISLLPGFQDHLIGDIIGVDGNTGAGGAEVWEYGDFFQLLDGTQFQLKGIPFDSNMRFAIRRNLRVGARAGTPIEDLGIKPEVIHPMTRNDLLERNKDLIREASDILKGKPGTDNLK